MNARAAAIVCGLITLPGGVVAATGADKLESWREQTRDSQTWSERMSTEASPVDCGSPRGPCRLVNVEVRNDRGDKPLHCGGSVKFPQPNAHRMREWGWTRWIIVAPGQSAIVNTARVPTDLAVEDIHSDCRTTEPPPMTTAIQDVTAPPSTGKTIQRNGAQWTERYDAAGYPKTCGTPEYTDYCLPGKLLVRNETATPMLCRGEIRMPAGNKLSLPSASRDMIVMGFRSAVLVKTMTAVNTHAESHSSDCKPWQPPPSVSTAGCKFKLSSGGIQLDYPPGAKEREEEGPVVLHFTLAASPGRPGNIEVAGSSLFPELDAAAVRALAESEMTTECTGARFSVLLRYKLED
jgi:TonB family protein